MFCEWKKTANKSITIDKFFSLFHQCLLIFFINIFVENWKFVSLSSLWNIDPWLLLQKKDIPLVIHLLLNCSKKFFTHIFNQNSHTNFNIWVIQESFLKINIFFVWARIFFSLLDELSSSDLLQSYLDKYAP